MNKKIVQKSQWSNLRTGEIAHKLKIFSFSKYEIITSELLSSALEVLFYEIKFISQYFKTDITHQITPGY